MERRKRGSRLWTILSLLLTASLLVSCHSWGAVSEEAVSEEASADREAASGQETVPDSEAAPEAETPPADETISAEETDPADEAVSAEEANPERGDPSAAEADYPRARERLTRMTLHEKVCQLFVVFPTAVTGTSTATVAGDATRAGLEAWPVGGFLYDRGNMRTQDQLRAMLEGAQSMARIPLILTCDEEGGRVNRLMGTVGTPYVGPMLRYRAEGPERAAENAKTIAEGLVSCGFNLDLAPVADVWSNPANTVIGDRAYSTDYQEAAELVAAAVEGFHRGGAACTLKHFPGHGSTTEDSHDGSAYVRKTLDDLRREDLLPFAAGIRAGADAVMIGHLTLPEADEEPAPFSHAIVTDLLREELGFRGVVMTDSLQMKALSDTYTSEEMAVRAIQAGVDMLLCPPDLAAAVAGLEAAVESGEIDPARLDESVYRILALKEDMGLL